jgi:pectinesterase
VKEGWNNWSNPENEKTVLYAEYNSYGPGSDHQNRVSWSKQLSPKQAKQYTLQNIFRGRPQWIPN